jgi:hypothetical protein
MMQRVEDLKLCDACGIQDLKHMGNTGIGFRNNTNTVPYLATFGNEVFYGSITRSEVISFSYVTFAILASSRYARRATCAGAVT